MSARAAAQLESKGFTEVCQYPRGKADWIVRGLPSEPAAPLSERLRALPYFVHNLAPAIRRRWIQLSRRRGVAHRMADDLPRLRLGDPLPSSLRAGVPPPFAVVLDGAGVLLGAIDTIRPELRADEMMNPAPQTIRPDMTCALAKSLLRHAPYLLVTEADGRYLGRYPRQRRQNP